METRNEKFGKPKIVSSFLPVDAPIKKTIEVDFSEALSPMIRKGAEEDVKELFAALTSSRQMVLWAFDRDRTMISPEEMQSRLTEYCQLLRGFVKPPASSEEDKKEGRAETLRHVLGIVWRDLLDVKGRDWRACDVALEEASMLLAASQSIMSRAAREAVSEANALKLHSTLRAVAGMLARVRMLVDEADQAASESSAPTKGEEEEEVKEEESTKIRSSDVNGEEQPKEKKKGWFSKKKKKDEKIEDVVRASSDLRLALPEAWAQLALAQAQHATIRKACQSSHIDWSLIASLCVDQYERYSMNVSGHVQALTKAAPEASSVTEWAGKRVAVKFLKSHVDMKSLYFESLFLYCQGAPYLEKAIAETDEVACSKALAHLSASASKHKAAQSAADTFASTAKPITYIHSPVLPLAESYDLIKRALDRANQLNDSIFHKPPTSDLDPVPEKKSLITAIPYDQEDQISSLWTLKAWDAFDPSKIPEPSFGVASASRECCTVS